MNSIEKMLHCVASMQSDFGAWLVEELGKRGWPQAEFARRAGVSPASVSRVISGESKPGDEFLNGTARALGIPVESVMRRVGKLPETGEILPEARDWSARLSRLDAPLRERTIAAMEAALQVGEAGQPPEGRSR